MPAEKKKRGLLSQIIVAVAITLLAGGTAPWWWNEIKTFFHSPTNKPLPTPVTTPPTKPIGNTLQFALEDFEAVQKLYNQSKTFKTCVQIRTLIEQIRVYTGNQRLVPESFRYSILYPSKKPNPTISDLATDRITRMKKVNSKCFS